MCFAKVLRCLHNSNILHKLTIHSHIVLKKANIPLYITHTLGSICLRQMKDSLVYSDYQGSNSTRLNRGKLIPYFTR
jgi:hypothetical protein